MIPAESGHDGRLAVSTARPSLGYDLDRDLSEARLYGVQAAGLPEWLGRSWGEVAPLLAQGWADRHAEVCCGLHDWRLSFRAVRAGWYEASGVDRVAARQGDDARR